MTDNKPEIKKLDPKDIKNPANLKIVCENGVYMEKEITPVTLPTPPLSATDKLSKRQDDLENVIADLIIKQFGGSAQ